MLIKVGGAAKHKMPKHFERAHTRCLSGGVAPPVELQSGARPPCLWARKAESENGSEATDFRF